MSESGGRAPAVRDLRDPLSLLGLGFGAGLAPRAPGTVGTLAALPLWWLLAALPPAMYAALVLVLLVAGVFICEHTARRLGVHDHPGIVFDEFVGYFITLWALPQSLGWMLAGFVVFRIIDIAKPWPINLLDRRVGGGLGIMADDVAAGVAGCALLHLAAVLIN